MPKDRKKSVTRANRIMRIFCEGAVTEPLYFRAYIEQCAPKKCRKLIFVEKTKKNTPVQIVDEACIAKKGNNSIDGDQFWAVYDRESTAKYPDELHDKALNKAKANGVNIALSNVCFEHWLLLHFTEAGTSYGSFSDLAANSEFKRLFKSKSGKEYEKAAICTFDTLKDGINEARVRAKKLNNTADASADPGRDRPHHKNPYITIPDLLDAIDKFDGKMAKN